MSKKENITICSKHPKADLIPGMTLRGLEEENLVIVSSFLACTEDDCHEKPWRGVYAFNATSEIMAWIKKYHGLNGLRV